MQIALVENGLGQLTLLLLSIFLFLTSHEVSFADSALLIGTLAIDLISGSIIWILLCRKSKYFIFELFGLGVAIGSVISTVAQLLLKISSLQPFANLLIFAVLVGIFIINNRRAGIRIEVEPTPVSSTLGVLAISMVLMSADRYYLWSAVLLLFVGGAFLNRLETANPSAKRLISLTALGVAVLAISMRLASLVEFKIFGQRSTIDYVSGWDGVIFEASSKALIKYGPFDNIFLSNIKYAYYWFHDAWAGAYTQRAHISDWVVTTQFGAIVVATGVAALLYVVVSRRIKPQFAIFVVLVLTTTPSLIGAPSALLSLASFSQMIALYWLVIIVFLLDEYFSTESSSILVIFSSFLTLIVMTKLTIAVPIFVGLIVVTCTSRIVKQNVNPMGKIFAATFVATAISLALYLIFIKPKPEFAQSYFEYAIGFTEKMFGIVTGVLILDIFVFVVIRLIGPLLNLNLTALRQSAFMQTLLGISLKSLSCALLIEFELSVANTYMLVPFLVCFTLVIGINSALSFENFLPKSRLNRPQLALALIIGLSSGAISSYRLHELNYRFVENWKPVFIASLLPIFGVILASVVLFFWRRVSSTPATTKLFIAATCLAVPVGSYVAHSFREVQRNRIYDQIGWVDNNSEDVKARYEELKPAADFMSHNLSKADVIASNSTSDYALLAAMTGIRNFASSAVTEMQGIQSRFPIQFKFAQSPTDETYNALRNECVTWFYYDRDENNTELGKFEQFSSVAFKDDMGLILKLSDASPLPTKCGE